MNPIVEKVYQASVTAGLRKKEAMNLALPSGSSPPEKPPGSMTMHSLKGSSDGNLCFSVAYITAH